MPKHPNITVSLLGEDGNAFIILGKVKKALQKAGVSAEERKQFYDEATNGDYNHLLRTCMEWVEVV